MAFTHRFDPTTLREYDIRGMVGRTLHPTPMPSPSGAASAASWRVRAARTVAVGYDGRLSSPELEEALVEGLSASGIEAVRIGRGPTPMLYYAATTLKTDGAVMVTGSHNPPDYNGFKMVLARQAVLRRADPSDWVTRRWLATWWMRPRRRSATFDVVDGLRRTPALPIGMAATAF